MKLIDIDRRQISDYPGGMEVSKVGGAGRTKKSREISQSDGNVYHLV